MSRIQTTWVIKNKKNQIKGPFPTEVLLKMISDGQLSGEELVASLPGGVWKPITKEADFYDHLLKVIEEQQKIPAEIPKINEPQALAETVILPPNSSGTAQSLVKKNKDVFEKTQTQKQTSTAVIDLSAIEKVSIKNFMQEKKSILFLFLSGFCILILFLTLNQASPDVEKIRLLLPR
ncbi:MAG: hypothetical protein ACOYOK_16355, partial [Pseudobdellovibrionaceae bacterium]